MAESLKQLNIRISDEDLILLEAEAFLKATTVSKLVLDATLSHIDDLAIRYKLGLATGLIGASNPVLNFLERYDAK